MHSTIMLLSTPDPSPWLTFVERVGLPVALAAALLYWFATRLEKRLEEQTAADREQTKALVEVGAALRSLKEEVAEVREDIGEVRETTGKHIVPPEFRGKKRDT